MNHKKIKELKNTYLNYGPEFWVWKKCNACRDQFTPENYSKIELVFSEQWKVDEYCGSEGMEVKWYHKACLVSWNEAFKGLFKSDKIPIL